jgi:hypothetical protein
MQNNFKTTEYISAIEYYFEKQNHLLIQYLENEISYSIYGIEILKLKYEAKQIENNLILKYYTKGIIDNKNNFEK